MRRDPTRTVAAVEDPGGLGDPGSLPAVLGEEVEGRCPPGCAGREVVQAKAATNPGAHGQRLRVDAARSGSAGP